VTGLSRPGDPELKPLSPQGAQALTRDLGRLDALQDREGVLTFSEPAVGSTAASDLVEPERFYAHHLAQTCIRAALDHLVAWRHLQFKAGIMPMYAHMSLLRTAHEAALLAEWLMDPVIDDDTRRARGIAVQLEDYDERRKFEDSTGGPRMPLQGKNAAGRIADLKAVAGRLGLTKTNRKGEVVRQSLSRRLSSCSTCTRRIVRGPRGSGSTAWSPGMRTPSSGPCTTAPGKPARWTHPGARWPKWSRRTSSQRC